VTVPRRDPAWALPGPWPLVIDGKPVQASDGGTYETDNPYTGERLATIARGTAADAERAVRAARAAFDTGPWPRLSPNQRGEILGRIARLMDRERDRLSYLETLEIGKPFLPTYTHMLQGVFAWDYFAGKARDQAEEYVKVAAGTHFNYRVHEPVGVVAEILPWNGPAVALAQKVSGIICTGNTVVVKPSSEAALSVLAFAAMLEEAGLPPGVVNVVAGPGGTVGETLIRHKGVDMISLTGSVETGQHVMQIAAADLKPVALELGGKNPNVVFPDTNVDEAAMWAVIAAFSNNGQICVSGSRLIVHESIHDAVVEKIVARLKGMRMGDPLDDATQIGTVISPKQRATVLEYVQAGVAEGATLVYGGGVPDDPALRKGCFVTPAVFTEVTPGMRIAQEEIFGPVLAVMKFKTEEEALALANGVDFGLAGAVWTADLQRALRVAGKMDAGQVYVNGYYSPAMSESPGVGRKKSGYGEAGYLKYTVPKTVLVRIQQ